MYLTRPAMRATLADIVKTNTYVTDFEEFSKHGDTRMRYFGPATPTSTTVEIRRLAGPDFMIEIEAMAFVDSERTGQLNQPGSVSSPASANSLKPPAL